MDGVAEIVLMEDGWSGRRERRGEAHVPHFEISGYAVCCVGKKARPSEDMAWDIDGKCLKGTDVLSSQISALNYPLA